MIYQRTEWYDRERQRRQRIAHMAPAPTPVRVLLGARAADWIAGLILAAAITGLVML